MWWPGTLTGSPGRVVVTVVLERLGTVPDLLSEIEGVAEFT